MDEISKETLKSATEVMLRPAAKVVEDIIGVFGGDRLNEYRARQVERRQRRREEVTDKAKKILVERKVDGPVEPNESAVDDLVHAAENEPRDELQALWAKLLAAMFDPVRATSFRREFIEIAKELEPLDAAILPLLNHDRRLAPTRQEFIANQLNVSRDEVELSFRNLLRLELVSEGVRGATSKDIAPFTTALGRRFLAALT